MSAVSAEYNSMAHARRANTLATIVRSVCSSRALLQSLPLTGRSDRDMWAFVPYGTDSKTTYREKGLTGIALSSYMDQSRLLQGALSDV